MKNNWSLGRLCLIWIALFLSASVASAEPVRPRTPIKVNGKELGSITFVQLFFKIEDNDRIDGLKDKYVVLFNQEIQKYGYEVKVPKSAGVFKDGEVPDADFALAGALTDVNCADEEDVTCGVTIEWELYHQPTDSVVYKMTAHHEEKDLSEMTSDNGAERLLLGGLHSLLSRPKFSMRMKEIMAGTASGDQPITGSIYNSAVIRRCSTKDIEMPKGAEEALKATAVIKIKNGVGSAVFISPDGYLLTAAHVATQDNLDVRMRDGSVHPAEVVRIDTKRDVALLRLKDRSVETSCLALSTASASAGEDVYAIGAPGGEDLSFSISRGIVSGKRTFDGVSFVQTDASIDPGNSGGPLVTSKGQVMAIASWKIGGQAMEGLGFGAPSTAAMEGLAFQFGDQTETIAASVKRVDSSDAYQDTEDPKWFYVGEDAPGKTPGWVGGLRFTGWMVAIPGSTALILGLALHDPKGYGSDMTGLIVAGAVATGVGVGLIITSYAAKPHKKPEDYDSARSQTATGAQLALVPQAHKKGGGLALSLTF